VYPVFDIRAASYYREREDLNFAPLTVETLDESSGKFWVVIGLFAGTDEEAIKKYMLGDYDLVSEEHFSRLNLYLYEKRTER
jgi:hypothetical protein